MCNSMAIYQLKGKETHELHPISSYIIAGKELFHHFELPLAILLVRTYDRAKNTYRECFIDVRFAPGEEPSQPCLYLC